MYLPKIQTAEEAALWNDILCALETHLQLPVGTIKAYVLVEQLEASVSQLEKNLTLARSNLDNLLVRAPRAGQLTSLDAEIGESKGRGQRLGQIDDVDRFKAFFHGMLDHGVYLAPSAFEAGFVSAAHGDSEIGQTLDAARKVFATL